MRFKDKVINISGWDYYSLVILFFSVIIQLLKWRIFPIFIDIYYHLLTASGFNEAGGWVSTCFWEYAPVGRPQVYPPLLHIFILFLIKTGMPVLIIGKLIQFLIYPALLFVIWYVIREIFNQRLAFFALVMIFSSYAFYLSAINTLAASLSLIFCFLSLLFLERNKITASALFLTISFYGHGYTSWFFVTVFILYAVLNRTKLSLCLKVVLSAIFLSSPLLIFQFHKRNYFLFLGNIFENYYIELDLINWFFLLYGLITCLRKKGRYKLFLALFVSSIIFLSSGHIFRYLSFYGIISIVFMNAAFFSDIYDRLFRRYRRALLIIFISVFILSPVLSIDLLKGNRLKDIFTLSAKDEYLVFRRGVFTLNFLDSSLSNFIFYCSRFVRTNETTIYFSHLFSETVEAIKKNSGERDIIYVNFPYTGGILSLLSGRSTSSAMLSEVEPYSPFDKILVSKLIIWQKNSERIGQEPVNLIKRYHLNKIADTKLAFIYENPACSFKKQTISATISYRILLTLIFLVFVLIVWSAKFGIDKYQKNVIL